MKGALDWGRLLAALLVVAIHTSPLGSFNAEADFVLTRIVARLAVPFFMLCSGYFLLGEAGPRQAALGVLLTKPCCFMPGPACFTCR